jgi:hypothetical protein
MDMLLQCDGSWENTALFESGQGLTPAELYIEIACGFDAAGNYVRGGVSTGGELAAYFRLADQPTLQQAVFPGAIEMQMGTYCIRLEHPSPILDITGLQVWVNGQFISDRLVGLIVQIDADQGAMIGQLQFLEYHTLLPDELVSVSLI